MGELEIAVYAGLVEPAQNQASVPWRSVALRSRVQTPRSSPDQASILQGVEKSRRFGQANVTRRMLQARVNDAFSERHLLVPELQRCLDRVFERVRGVDGRDIFPPLVVFLETGRIHAWKLIEIDVSPFSRQALGRLRAV